MKFSRVCDEMQSMFRILNKKNTRVPAIAKNNLYLQFLDFYACIFHDLDLPLETVDIERLNRLVPKDTVLSAQAHALYLSIEEYLFSHRYKSAHPFLIKKEWQEKKQDVYHDRDYFDRLVCPLDRKLTAVTA